MKGLLSIAIAALFGVCGFMAPALHDSPAGGAHRAHPAQPSTQVTQAMQPPKQQADRETRIAPPLPNNVDLQARIGTTRFGTLAITIDPLGAALAAYQFEITSPDASFTVLSIEPGEGAAALGRTRPPYYDKSAEDVDTERLIVADYAAPGRGADALPTGPVHIVTLHVMFTQRVDAGSPTITLTPLAVGDADGNAIDAEITHTFNDPGNQP